MKKLFAVLLLVFLAALPFVLADENSTQENQTTTNQTNTTIGTNSTNTTDDDIDDDTEEELKIMNSTHGAEMRLLQLQKSITRNILWGNAIINALNGQNGTNASANVTELQSIIAEMELLKAQVNSTDPAAANATRVFVDLKADARDLSKQFRDKTRAIVKAGDIPALKKLINSAKNDETDELDDEIKEKQREYNEEQIRKAFEVLGIDDEDLLNRFLNGTATKDDVHGEIRERLKSMTPEEKKHSADELKEEDIKRNIFQKSTAAKIQYNYMERQQERLSERLNELQDEYNETDPELSEKAAERIQERIHQISEQQEKIIEKAQERRKSGDSSNEIEEGDN